MQDHPGVCGKGRTTMKDDYNCCYCHRLLSHSAIMPSAPGCSPTCAPSAQVLTALPEPNFILVGFSKAGFAQVV